MNSESSTRLLELLNNSIYLAHKDRQVDSVRRFGAELAEPCTLVEIGSNRGRFAFGLARAFPDRQILAIEWRDKWVRHVQTKCEELGVTNLHCLSADARIALPLLAPIASIEKLFLLYPDPWWKKRHEHRRLLDEAFFEAVAELLAPRGELLIKTDVRLIYDQVRDATSQVGALEVLQPDDWPDECEWEFSTRERQCLDAGIATYRHYLRKREGQKDSGRS